MYPLQRRFESLPPAMQQEITKAAHTITVDASGEIQPVLASFVVDGREHKAYLVPNCDPDSETRLSFECLVY